MDLILTYFVNIIVSTIFFNFSISHFIVIYSFVKILNNTYLVSCLSFSSLSFSCLSFSSLLYILSLEQSFVSSLFKKL